MSLVSSSIPNFVNGISQQPFTLRLSSQGELQENGLSTVSSGLRKRPPTEHLAKISSTPLTDAFVHMINRDGTEQYQVIVTNGDLKVYDLAGNAKTVNFTDRPYLTTASAVSTSFALTTVADYTFIVNKTVKVTASPTVSPSRPFEALINVKAGNYGKTYKILINGTVVSSIVTPDGTDAASGAGTFTETINYGPEKDASGNLVPHPTGTYTITNPGMKAVERIGTDAIAASLMTPLIAAGYNTAPWSVTQYGSVIYIKNTAVNFTVACEDGFNNNALVAIKDKLHKFSDLPANPRVDSFVVQITGDASSAFDNYWVTFDASGTNNATGVWKETIAPGTALGFNASTMPHQLIREADGTFSFKPAVWSSRLVGDIKSSPNPSCVGGVINDIFFFQNRLGILSDENYIQSETGKYFNFFRTTITTLLDSDPVDVSAATNKVAVLSHAVSFNKQLLLFSNQQQFVVESDQMMTPKRVPIKPTTDYEVNTLAKPVAAGRNVYFSADKGDWTSVREYYADANNLSNDAADVTSHVPRYIPAGIVKIAAGPGEDVLALLSGRDRTKLYIYRYYFSGSEKLQSSWSLFNFSAGGTILNCDFIRSALYLVISRPDGVYFERMNFAIGASSPGEPYHVRLDRKVRIDPTAMTFDGAKTTISAAAIGYPLADGTYMSVAHGGGIIKAGQILKVTITAGVASLKGDQTASPLTFGLQYTFRYTVSPLTVKFRPPTGSQGSSQSDTEGRTQIRKIAFNHSDAGFYKVLVTPEARQTYTYTFAGKILGSSSAEIGAERMSTGRFAVPVMSRNTSVAITVESDMPNPMAILSADWEAVHVKRSQPV